MLTVEFEGQSVPLVELARSHGIDPLTMRRRYKAGKRGAELVAPPTQRGPTAAERERLEESIRQNRRNTAKALAAELGRTEFWINDWRRKLWCQMAKEGRL